MLNHIVLSNVGQIEGSIRAHNGNGIGREYLGKDIVCANGDVEGGFQPFEVDILSIARTIFSR